MKKQMTQSIGTLLVAGLFTLPNLLQAQRDYFGAHTYERNDAPRGQMFHTEWPQVIG